MRFFASRVPAAVDGCAAQNEDEWVKKFSNLSAVLGFSEAREEARSSGK